jgi:cell division septation protein DedD
MRTLAMFGLAALLFGCGTPVRQNTASGRPEVTIANVPADRVKSALVNEMINGGYRITKDSQFEIAFDRPIDNLAAAVLFGSRYDAQPNARVAYSIAQVGSDVRVVADMAIITNPGSGFEQRTDVSAGADSPKIQELLNRVSASLTSVPPDPAASNKPSPASAGYVVQVATGKTAFDAQAKWRELQSSYPKILGSQQMSIKRVDLAQGTFYRVMVGPFENRDKASQMCKNLTAAGSQCVVQRD